MEIRKMNSADSPALYDVYTDKEGVNNNRYSADIKRDVNASLKLIHLSTLSPK